MAKSPLQQVKDRFGSKEALVKELSVLAEKTDLFVKRFNETKGLERVSNLKLLRLRRIAAEVQEKFETRAKLVDALVELQGRAKDADYKKHFDKHTLGRLLDVYRVAERRAKRAARKSGQS
ncbi:MAG: hypothetical protein HY905_13885 [Deltaproteobacteria bacterium]|nr:hypothetical protein [Deltaproteobacteria bacterium]